MRHLPRGEVAHDILCLCQEGTYQSNVGLCLAYFKLSTTNWYISG